MPETTFKMKRKVEGTNTSQKTKKLKKSGQSLVEGANNDTPETLQNISTSNDRKKKVKFEKPSVVKNGKIQKNKKQVAKKIVKGNKENLIKQVDPSTGKPNWAELRKTGKKLKEKRKAKKLTDMYDICIQAKQLSERLRRTDCTFEERKMLTTKLHELLKTHYGNVILTHDMARVIQLVLKYSDENIQEAIFGELKPQFVPILESKYARNCIRTIIRYGSKQLKKELVSACYGNVVRLMSNTLCSGIVDTLYSSHASDLEKSYFKQEFYGDLYKSAKDKNVNTLSDVFETATDMKTATLSALKGHLTKIINKKLIKCALVQTLLWEFLSNCSEADRSEMIVSLRELIVNLSQTKFGAKVATLCIWHGTNKDRKVIIKALKGHVKTIAMSENGYIVLLALMDSADDTVIMKKIVLSEIQNDATEIASNEYGKHVILYLVSRRDPHYFHPQLVEYLKQGDNNATSKKPADVREKELLEGIIDTLLEKVATETAVWLSNGSMSMITLAILKAGSGEKLKLAFESISAFIIDSKSRIKDVHEYRPIEHSGVHMLLKKLVQHDKKFHETGETMFGEVLINKLTTPVLREWIQFNRGCLLLVFLIENENESAVNNLTKKLKQLSSNLKGKNYSGASILLKKLK